ncbi:glycosyltransferase [Echinicola soli]|uniref:Glycosyltransferase n=1 Tax=Echinicola soli TaxID=2591634 RepID=A0A514CCR9_9BACT|nr:glycosyltransferase [Echinicola soli]QDH77580.1 glycosyltransferase [Echinicola soli]
MILWGALMVVAALLVQDLLLVYFFYRRFKSYDQSPLTKEDLPTVSILVPARNEENVLPVCLKGLSGLDYPEEKLQVIVADDHSDDQTGRILNEWVGESPNRLKVEIAGKYPHLNGKANALAQMAHEASGEFLLFTDADCEVNPQWVQAMVKAFSPRAGLVVGLTSVRRVGLFGKLQGQDWWLTLGMIKVSSDLGNLLTAVGNNMLINHKAYRRVGGFEGLPFSVTEDFMMGKAMKTAGFYPVFQYSKESQLLTKSETGLVSLLEQRKRWMKGARSLPWYWQALLVFQVLFFPMVISILFYAPLLGAGLWMCKLVFQVIFVRGLAKKVDIYIPLWELFIFEVYYLVISWSTIVCYFWPSKINWKERKY